MKNEATHSLPNVGFGDFIFHPFGIVYVYRPEIVHTSETEIASSKSGIVLLNLATVNNSSRAIQYRDILTAQPIFSLLNRYSHGSMEIPPVHIFAKIEHFYRRNNNDDFASRNGTFLRFRTNKQFKRLA